MSVLPDGNFSFSSSPLVQILTFVPPISITSMFIVALLSLRRIMLV